MYDGVKEEEEPGRYRPAWRMIQHGARSTFSPRATLRMRSFFMAGKSCIEDDMAGFTFFLSVTSGAPQIPDRSSFLHPKLGYGNLHLYEGFDDNIYPKVFSNFVTCV
jgi:hypothetical protein